ncbi:hypothetical protein [Streptomyces sp. NPDC000410]|uniref:hypothetical protein n=1 Tax=Streptomyces sp. NPDC000410 TaxID=3154254 RepID=UPI00331ABB68
MLRLYVCAVVVIGTAGYAATSWVISSTPAATPPPAPYASPSVPDCDPPEKNPVSCDGAYGMTCEETAEYYRRLEATRPGTAHVVVCAESAARATTPPS